MKIITIVGARPQFIKAAAISRAIREHNQSNTVQIDEVIIHTGQHFDTNMSEVFFTELEISEPDYNLEIDSLSHGAMTGRMLESIEKILQKQAPDLVLVYGDTNSTLAGALAASKMHIPVAHVEAGLRSFNMNMPEEINRILSDRISNYLLCPTEAAIENLRNEGVVDGVYNVGDVMYDVTLYYKGKAQQQVRLDKWDLEENAYVLCTLHRAENTDNVDRLSSILNALREIAEGTKIIMPIHPRTRKLIDALGKKNWLAGLAIIEPIPYLEMLRLEASARVIMTDSGGMQKEAFFHKVPCITMRDETEWIETVELGWNQLTGANEGRIINAYQHVHEQQKSHETMPYGSGNAAEKILNIIQG